MTASHHMREDAIERVVRRIIGRPRALPRENGAHWDAEAGRMRRHIESAHRSRSGRVYNQLMRLRLRNRDHFAAEQNEPGVVTIHL
jgi:hypothetical protein